MVSAAVVSSSVVSASVSSVVSMVSSTLTSVTLSVSGGAVSLGAEAAPEFFFVEPPPVGAFFPGSLIPLSSDILALMDFTVEDGE